MRTSSGPERRVPVGAKSLLVAGVASWLFLSVRPVVPIFMVVVAVVTFVAVAAMTSASRGRHALLGLAIVAPLAL